MTEGWSRVERARWSAATRRQRDGCRALTAGDGEGESIRRGGRWACTAPALFPVGAPRVALRAMMEFLSDLRRQGTQRAWLPRMRTRQELYELIEYDQYTRYEERYLSPEEPVP